MGLFSKMKENAAKKQKEKEEALKRHDDELDEYYIFDTFVGIVVEYMGENDSDIDFDSVTTDTYFASDLELDEIDLYEIFLRAGNKFEFEVNYEAVLYMSTIGDAVAYINENWHGL